MKKFTKIFAISFILNVNCIAADLFQTLNGDIQKKILSLLDIQCMARLEQCSKGTQIMILRYSYHLNEAIFLALNDTKIGPDLLVHMRLNGFTKEWFNWSDVKQIELKHKSEIPWIIKYVIAALKTEFAILWEKQDKNLFESGRFINDTLIELGSEDAYRRKLSGLSSNPIGSLGYFCYDFDPEKSRQLKRPKIEKTKKVETRYFNDIIKKYKKIDCHKIEESLRSEEKLKGLRKSEIRKFWIYLLQQRSLIDQHMIVEHFVKQNNPYAIEFKYLGLCYGTCGYNMNLTELQEFIKWGEEVGNCFLIHMKAILLPQGSAGFEKNIVESNKIRRKYLRK